MTSLSKTRPNARPSFSCSLIGLILVISVLSPLGCASSPESAGAQTPATDLPKGINDVFLSSELDVDEFKDRFEGESRAVYAKRNEIVDALKLAPGDAIADIGAGTGFFTLLFVERVGPTGVAYAVEISPNFLEHLQSLSNKDESGILRPVLGTETSVELPVASVDLAFICDVYHHFAHPEKSLASLREAIRPGGSLVLIDFERIPGKSPAWLLEHVRAGRAVFQSEIEEAGFAFVEEIEIEGLEDNYFLRFERIE